MNRPEFQQFLKEEIPSPTVTLPENFSREVLLRSKRFRELLEQHWKRLTIATTLSLVIAVAITLGISATLPENNPAVPPLLLFHGSADAAPFSTK